MVGDVPAALAASAKSRLNALARAAKSAGSADPVPMLEAKAGLGLLLGTFQHIPPPSAAGGPGDGGGPDGGWDPGDWDPGEGDHGGWGGGDGGPGPEAPGPAGGGARENAPDIAPGDPLDERPPDARGRDLAAAAAADPAARWQVIVTDDAGRATGVAAVRRRGTAETPGMIDEVTLTLQASLAARLARSPDLRQRIARDLARLDPDADRDHGPLADALAEAVTAANRAAAQAWERTWLDAAAGGCAHTMEAKGYRVTGTLRRWVATRDRTCRNPVCRRRAVQCDQDHTVPYDRGGRTCPCDLGSLCRTHHQLKQLPGWHLSQEGGVFTWTTPAGLVYRKEPHSYPV